MSNKTCFVVTAIGQAGSQERIHADKVFTYLIEPVCSELNIQVIRVDRETTNGDINESILNHLKNDDLVIADLTGYNANAFYEFGYRQALGLPVVPIIKHDQRLPFDVISKRTVFYDTDVSTIEDSKLKLKNMILDFKNFIMPNKRDDTKSELEIIIEKLDLIIEQTKPQKTSSSSLTNYDAIGNE
ncbi:TPA: hypothetical protein U1318_002077, partial [Streptococcus suis]|nr:hypothetical protein [Streptococcus suis]